jgi:glycolate oxidase iron-sulfur subunit
MIDLNDDLLKEVSECIKCGMCLSVCPVYKELCEESYSPRGHTALAEELGRENLDFTAKLIEIFTKCLACEGCEAVCPKSIPTAKMVYEVREMLYKKRRYDAPLHSVVKLLYSSPYIFTLLLKNATLLRPFLFEDLKKVNLLKPRINLPFLNKSRTIPKVKRKFFLDNDFDTKSKSKAHISLFSGCIFNYIYPDIAMNSLNILKQLQKDVHVCTEQICCGLPALSVGDFHGLKELVLKNVDILDETHPEKIVVLCSSCSLMFKKYYPMVFDGESESVINKIRRFSSKVIDFTMYLREHNDELENIYKAKDFKAKEKTIVTYHQPCHLSKGLKAGNVIKEIIEDIENIELVELENPDACCGYGGIFNYKYSDLSLKISDRKVRDILDTKAKIVITSCSGCIMQLKEGLLRHNSKIKVLHISQFIKTYVDEIE